MILLIDNYDSFTYNVFQLIANLGKEVKVVRNDCITIEEIDQGNYGAIIISPGPGTPDESGICKEVVKRYAGQIPIFGICLGHQTIGEVFGGKVIRAPYPIHGKKELVTHYHSASYKNVKTQFVAGRYHSLIVEEECLPDCLEITARSSDNLIMGLRHKDYKIEGVQFHPESILTPEGAEILKEFLKDIN